MLNGLTFISSHMPDENTDENTAQPEYKLSALLFLEKACGDWLRS